MAKSPVKINQISKVRTTLKTRLLQQTVEPNEQILKVLAATSSTSILILGTNSINLARLGIDSLITLNPTVYTNDKLLLWEIVRQLKLQNISENFQNATTFADCFKAVLDTLYHSVTAKKEIVFVLEHFELFCSGKQALIYNLFDAVQYNQNLLIKVLCCTQKITAVDLMEKRVKSRFSSRSLYFPFKKNQEEMTSHLLGIFTLSNLPGIEKEYTMEFNEKSKEMIESPEFQQVLEDCSELNQDIIPVLNSCARVVDSLSPENPFIVLRDFLNTYNKQSISTTVLLLSDISLLEFCLLVAMTKLHAKEIFTYNFEIVFDEYLSFLRSFSMKGKFVQELKFTKSVSLSAFESLLSNELIQRSEYYNSKSLDQFKMIKSVVHPSQLKHALKIREKKNESSIHVISTWLDE